MPRRDATFTAPLNFTAPLRAQWQIAENTFNWYKNGLQWMEMLTASTATIGLRLAGINQSVQNNEIPDGAEMLRMVTEKNKALLKSTLAAGEWQAAYRSKSWPDFQLPWQAFNYNVFDAPNLLAQSIQWHKMMLNGFAKTMRPYHSASTANAARLSRKK